MTTLANLIADHNRLASHFDDVKPIVKFSASKAKLQERIDALRARLEAIDNIKATTFTAADLAREIGANGKVLRAKIRRKLKEGVLPAYVNGTKRWPNDERDNVIAILA